MGSGREFTLHFFHFLLCRNTGTVAYHPGGLRTSNFGSGGGMYQCQPQGQTHRLQILPQARLS